MTTLHWTRAELSREFSGCANLQDVIQTIEKMSYKNGEVICEVRVNGVLLSESDETKYATNLRESIEDLSVSTNRTDSLIQEALLSTQSFIPELEKSCVSAAESLRGAATADAQRHFGETLKGCQWLVDTLGYIRGAASGIKAPILRTERWAEAEQLIMKTVREMSRAYGNNDSVLVADLMEYELTAALSTWSEVLESERERRALAA